MGLEFFSEYGGQRYVSDADVYRQTYEHLKNDLQQFIKTRDELLLIIRCVSAQPFFYQTKFKPPVEDITRAAGIKLMRTCREIARIQNGLDVVSENLRLKIAR